MVLIWAGVVGGCTKSCEDRDSWLDDTREPYRKVMLASNSLEAQVLTTLLGDGRGCTMLDLERRRGHKIVITTGTK